MFDRSLGDTVTLDGYHGLFIEGRPLHQGPCTDDVYGCRKCNSALSRLPDNERKLVTLQGGVPINEAEFDLLFTFTCDWCVRKLERLVEKGVPANELPSASHDVSQLCYHSCADEGGSVMYELCDDCDSRCGCREYDDEDYDHEGSCSFDSGDDVEDEDDGDEVCDNGTYFDKDDNV